jgi:hypothetical protein
MGTIKVIAEHSVDLDLLTGGVCIDVGCRGFAFSEAMRDFGCEVWAFDLEKLEAPPGISFYDFGISNICATGFYVDTKDQQAKYLSSYGCSVMIVSLNEVYKNILTEQSVDILKLDCESSEYFILSDPNFQPIPRQISVEFHMHAHRALHDQYYEACMKNLLQHYEPVKHELTEAHGAGKNYWDSLFLRKDLL